MPSGSGRTSGSFLTPFIWNKLARTFAISEKKKLSLVANITISIFPTQFTDKKRVILIGYFQTAAQMNSR